MSAALVSRALLVATLAAAAIGCDNGACHGVDGTCVALTVTGQGSVDGVQLTLSGAAMGTKVAPANAQIHTLPVEIAVQPPSAANGAVHLDVVGVLLGSVVGSGSTDVTVSPGAHTSATVALTPGGSVGGGDGGAPFEVTGKSVVHYQLGDGGVVDVPADVSGDVIAAEVGDGDGGVTYIPGGGDANGNITVHRVPSAPYYLRFDDSYLFGSAKSFDLGYWVGGRPDQARPTKTTMLQMNLTNAAPWAAGDALELFSMNAGTAVFRLETVFNPGAGATSLNGAFDLSKVAFGGLIDSTKGDDAFLIQLVADSNNGVPYQRLATLASFAPFSMQDGVGSTIAAAMTAVPQSGSLPVAWSRSQFAQYRTAVNPNATADVDAFSVFAMPWGTDHGWYTSTPDVVVVNPPAGASDVSLTATYGNPFPSSWPLVAAAGTQFAVTYMANGATATTFDGAIFTFAPLDSAPSPVVPVISPVQSFTVDGQDALAGVPTASARATVAWSPPAIGTPSSYSVGLYSIDNVAGQTKLDYVATLYTTETSVSVPPGLLAGNQPYLFVVTAYAEAIDRSRSPYLAALPTAYADALSGSVHVGLAAEAQSCKALHTAHPDLPDGVYTIDPDGSGPGSPFAVWCDMTTAGGGWTLCAWSQSSSKATKGFVPATLARSTNWFGCHLYSTTAVEALARVANATKSYTAQYGTVDLTTGGADRQYSSTAAPALTLGFTPNEGACNNASTGNLQWSISTTQSIYGLTPKDTCGTNKPTIFIGAAGVNTNGCWGTNQVPPQIGYPCGGYGDFGVHLELWVR